MRKKRLRQDTLTNGRNPIWKKKAVQLQASALAAVLLAGTAAPAAAWAEPFVFVDEEGADLEESETEESETEESETKESETEELKEVYASPSQLKNGRVATGSELSAQAATGSELPVQEATGSELSLQTASVTALSVQTVNALGDLWEDWDADFSFLDGSQGLGTKEKPYQIKNKKQLMGLSQLTAMGMQIQPGEGKETIIGDYTGAYFKLMSNLDLEGMDWNPIGFYRDTSELSGEVLHPFSGHFDGNGKTISNFRLNQSSWKYVGFFGLIKDASVKNLTIKPGKTVGGKSEVGILAGRAEDSQIKECRTEGHVTAAGIAGGIVGSMEGQTARSVAENCTARVTIAVQGGADLFAGGIAGKASGSTIADCRTETGDNNTARIQGSGATVGGMVGFQNDTDIYNSFVSGTIGGSGTVTAGGITGLYASGKLKVARFEGTIGQSGLGSAGHRGTFIGHREAGNWFIYGEDVAYLFADTEAKIAANVCGSTIPDDNEYTYAAKIGYSHSGDLFYSLVQGGLTRTVTDEYFYEVLEQGILEVLDEDLNGEGAASVGYELDHIAPNDAGRPVRGYLVTIPQIDTVSGGTNYYDVAVLEARGNNTYYRTIDKEHRGAVEAGKTVTVTTSPKHTQDARFQMDGVPTYLKDGTEYPTVYGTGGEYSFTMPEENTRVSASYEKVAVKVSVVPAEYRFSVVEERTGNRKDPVKTTKVYNADGRLIASYINGMLAQGTQVQPVMLEAVVDKQNDVADASVKWSLDDPELFTLLANTDEDAGGYTKQSASVRLNLSAGFFTDTIQALEQKQAANQYRYPISDTVYGAGHQNGGVAILTASTRPSASFEEKPCTANAKLLVTYQVKDKTYVAAEQASLNKEKVSFTVTRKLTGNRRQPQETITVTKPQNLNAAFSPSFFDAKEISWSTDDSAVLTVQGEGKDALVSARQDAKWIQDLMESDDAVRAANPTAVLKGAGSRTAKITVSAEDMLGNRKTAECSAEVQFVTIDETWNSSSSGGSSGGSGGSSGSSGKGSSKTNGAAASGPAGENGTEAANESASGEGAPAGSVTGVWSNTADGHWCFASGGRSYQNEWGYIDNPYAGNGQNRADWFWFDEKGHMVTGWQWILGADGTKKRYYFNEKSDGTRGSLLWNEKVDAFLQEFDWERMSDREKAEQIYRRIANGFSGNRYGVPSEGAEYPVFETGVGLCRDFAEEYAMLAEMTGLSCITYLPSENHEACLLQMDGLWYALDPSSGADFSSELTLKQVDFEEERNRSAKQQAEKLEAYYQEHPDSWAAKLSELDAKLARGEITEEQYLREWEEWRNKN